MLTNTHGLLLGSRGRTAQELSCLSSSSKYSKRPNTTRFLMHVFCFGLAPPGKPRLVSPFSQSHSAYYKSFLHHKQTAQTTDHQQLSRTEKQSQRERQAKRNIHKGSKCKKCLLEQTKPFCSFAKSRSQGTTFCWDERDFVYSVFNSSLSLKLSLSVFICLRLLFCKTSN